MAPPATMVDGLVAVPIDIDAITAVVTFDGATETGSASPVSQLAHHLMGAVPFTDVRVIESVQAAGSVHTLQLSYPLAMPSAQLGAGYLPAIEWSPGPKLRWVFGLSDLNRARYVEAWLPANLIFDQFRIDLEIQLVNTLAAHSIITTGRRSSTTASSSRSGAPRPRASRSA